MTRLELSEAKYAEGIAKDAFYAAHLKGKATKKLYDAMVTATKTRQEAMTAYAIAQGYYADETP